VFDGFKEVAQQLDIPTEIEVYPRYSGTDAMGMQVVAEGIPTMVLSIPLRYMHTPVEVISLKDVQRVGHLLAQYILRLTPDSLAKIRWEETQE
jgi:endoglucanase